MKFSQGVEWMLHGVAVIAQAPNGAPVARRALAERYDLPEAYLAKHLKSLVKAGVLTASTGPGGGFRLARPASEITALDVVEAVEGQNSPFTCLEIRQRGNAALTPAQCRTRCGIARMMDRAHAEWRASLRDTTVEDIVNMTPKSIRDRTARELAAARRS